MASRLKLQEDLENFLGSRNVYFQPPESVKLKYPAIIYDIYRVNQRFANNIPYRKLHCYSVTIIDRAPKVEWIDQMLDSFEYCSFDREYVADNLNHYSFTLYY